MRSVYHFELCTEGCAGVSLFRVSSYNSFRDAQTSDEVIRSMQSRGTGIQHHVNRTRRKTATEVLDTEFES